MTRTYTPPAVTVRATQTKTVTKTATAITTIGAPLLKRADTGTM